MTSRKECRSDLLCDTKSSFHRKPGKDLVCQLQQFLVFRRRDQPSPLERIHQMFQLEEHKLLLPDHGFDNQIRTGCLHSSFSFVRSISTQDLKKKTLDDYKVSSMDIIRMTAFWNK